jgi:nitrogen PTS system EIIA component
MQDKGSCFMKTPDIMTIEEVAEYLRVSERTVYDWANKGDIPCGKLGTAWRFKRIDIEKWVDSRLSAGSDKKDFTPLFMNSVLKAEHVIVVDKADKADILNQMIKLLEDAPEIKSKRDLEQGIYHREQLMSTGIGMGIGIPHVRLRSVRDVVMAVALVRDGVDDYESLDSEPVKLLFMIIARDDQHVQHLKLLSQISSRLKDEEYRQQLIGCSDAEQFYQLLTERA